MQQLVNELGIQVIAIDGKSLRGSYDRESGSKALPDRQCVGNRAAVGVGTRSPR